jgi:hypothetical protein
MHSVAAEKELKTQINEFGSEKCSSSGNGGPVSLREDPTKVST